jgi:3-oxoacyl-[acyl-carrier protein] reductase
MTGEATELEGRVALITGAAGGMGRAHAVLMAARGAAVAVQGIDAKGIAETADIVRENGGAEGIRDAEKKVPLGRWAQPDEIAYLIAFLASPRSNFITGQVISPNGGASIVGF